VAGIERLGVCGRLQYAAQERHDGLRVAALAWGDARRLAAWRRLTTSDHLYYMCIERFADGDMDKYFSPYESPYDAFIAFMNVAQDLEQSLAGPATAGDGLDWVGAAGLVFLE
jgi:alpha-amylase/alpha-mannosidase (GH57 family)